MQVHISYTREFWYILNIKFSKWSWRCNIYSQNHPINWRTTFPLILCMIKFPNRFGQLLILYIKISHHSFWDGLDSIGQDMFTPYYKHLVLIHLYEEIFILLCNIFLNIRYGNSHLRNLTIVSQADLEYAAVCW